MKLLLGLAALSVCSVSATPTPQLVGPLSSVGNFFQNTFQGFPRPPFFQNGFAFAPFRPQTQQVLIPPQQVAPTPQIIPAQENAQGFNVPIRQISNNGWYWQNWIPLPVIPQYPADQSPTIIIISHPAKPQTAANPTATANSVQSTNNSAVVPNTNESTNNTTLPTPVPAPASNSSESSLPTVAQSSAATTEGSTSITSPENITNVPDLGLTILNPVVPLAPLESTTNASLPETTAQ